MAADAEQEEWQRRLEEIPSKKVRSINLAERCPGSLAR